MENPVLSYTKQDLNDTTTVTVLEIDELSDSLRKYMDEHLAEICEGTYSDSLLVDVKDRIKELFKDKQSDNTEVKYTNWEMGAVAEFFIHLYLKHHGLKQECMFFNLEERSIKKGFDGYYTDESSPWIMESKSGSIDSEGASHRSKIQEAMGDLKKKFSGQGVKNNPWRNAFNHASHVDVGSANKLRTYLKQLSNDFTQKTAHDIDEFNIIPCATIYYDETDFHTVDEIFDTVTAGHKPVGKSAHIICVSHRSVGVFKEYIGIE